MKKILIAFVILIIVVIGAVTTQNYLKTQNLVQTNKDPMATINNNTFELIVAKTPKEMEIGLSETSELPKNKGMLFLFESPGYYSFWMRNMKIPIDIIYINNDKIVTIFSKAKPPQDAAETLVIYRPDEPSDKVIEINAGLAEEYSFKKGDKVILQNL
ncbi:MAG: DUF192 domain-containing protein [Candidatus Levybacteria bacterium]|nr:DUF192 domain-containing protein [Candidatus Levybacteria bacterium]